jgi:hypothetical protein
MAPLRPIALLNDEDTVAPFNLARRLALADQFRAIELGPKLKDLQYLQPQTGCFNACAFCAQDPGTSVWWFDEPALRDLLSAIKTISLEHEISQGRVNNADIDEKGRWVGSKPVNGILGYGRVHRPGQIFCYLDDDPFSYPHLDAYLSILSRDFGSRVRLTTVSYSRKNTALCAMHDSIAKTILDTIVSLRISVTPYTLLWKNSNQQELFKNEFAKDLSHTLAQYHRLKREIGFGKMRYSIEMRTPPFIEKDQSGLKEMRIGGHWVASVGSYTLIERKEGGTGPSFRRAEHLLAHSEGSLVNDHILVIGPPSPASSDSLIHIVRSFDKGGLITDKLSLLPPVNEGRVAARLCSPCRLTNIDGEYFCIDGQPDSSGRRTEIDLYSRTSTRTTAGAIYRVRHWLNNLIDLKLERGLSRNGIFHGATWDDAADIIDRIRRDADIAGTVSPTLGSYIRDELTAIPRLVAFAMERAGYDAVDFLSYGFVWDTGTITNLGRALTTIFHGLVSAWYHPLSLNEEKGYGYHSESDSEKRGPVLRIAPTPSQAEKALTKTQLGFRNPGTLVQGGVTVELLDNHIQPIHGYRNLIPGLPVRLSTSKDRVSRFLIPGA